MSAVASDAFLRVGVVLYSMEQGYCLHPEVPLEEIQSLSFLVGGSKQSELPFLGLAVTHLFPSR